MSLFGPKESKIERATKPFKIRVTFRDGTKQEFACIDDEITYDSGDVGQTSVMQFGVMEDGKKHIVSIPWMNVLYIMDEVVDD